MTARSATTYRAARRNMCRGSGFGILAWRQTQPHGRAPILGFRQQKRAERNRLYDMMVRAKINSKALIA